jgi:hypothetical protein
MTVERTEALLGEELPGYADGLRLMAADREGAGHA